MHPATDTEAVVGGLRTDGERFATRHERYRLDWTAASLARLDECCRTEYGPFATSDGDDGSDGAGEAGAPDADRALTARAMEAGGYFGVVLADVCAGEWTLDDGARVVIEGASARARIDPVAVATAVLRGEDSFADTYGALRRQLALDVPAVDPASAREAIRPPVDGLRAPDRDAVADLADDVVAGFPTADPDFTPASLYRLDDRLAAGGRPDPDALGAYLGSVLVRTHDATWTAVGDGIWAVALPDGSEPPPVLDPASAARSVLEGDATLAAVHDAAYETLAGAQ